MAALLSQRPFRLRTMRRALALASCYETKRRAAEVMGIDRDTLKRWSRVVREEAKPLLTLEQWEEAKERLLEAERAWLRLEAKALEALLTLERWRSARKG